MLYIGEIIRGKWNKNRYIVLKKLGQGGIGSVYKVRDELGNIRAIKISDDMNSITREYENMKKFQSMSIVPKIYEIDDYEKYGELFHFFTLEYIRGYNLKEIMKLKKFYLRDSLIVGLTILKSLKIIYDFGYIYSDLKLENIMIDLKKREVFLVDFGSLVDENLGIKEYTPTYSSVSWGLTDKTPSTSMIFSVNMLLTSMILKEEPSPLLRNLNEISMDIKKKPIDKTLKRTITKVLSGRHTDINSYMSDLQTEISKKSKEKDIDIIDFIFKGSIFLFISVLTICLTINWM